MAHTRSSSFFSFFKGTHSTDPKAHNRTMSDSQPIPQLPAPESAPNPNPNPNPPQMPLQTLRPAEIQSTPSQSPSLPLHPEIRSVVQLTIAHAHKVYFSGPLIRRIEYNSDGSKPVKDDGWTEVWAQLGGTTLSIWDMKEIEAASKQGREVPPSYINIVDAYIQVLGSVTVPATPTVPSKRYTNVLTLNNAGSNLYLFSCPTTHALISWAAAFRLASWEKSRLEEIYTAHLIRITLSARDVPTTLVKGKMEGWVRVRIAGQTDWKKLWLVVQEGSGETTEQQQQQQQPPSGAASVAASPQSHALIKKKRVSLFSRDTHSSSAATLPTKPLISMYLSPKPKDKKKPLLTIATITQAFAVYPERPELISKSTLIKLEGTFGDEDMGHHWRCREGWAMIMPEIDNSVSQAAEMLKWIVAIHDSFKLYGRPEAWTWDPRLPASLMYGYPVGPQKENLFLDRDIAETMDPREDRTSHFRLELKKLLQQHMRPPIQVVQKAPDGPDVPMLPPINGINTNGALPALPSAGTEPAGLMTDSLQLPPFSFNNTPQANSAPVPVHRPLTPITERDSVLTHNNQTVSPTSSIPSPSHQNPLLLSQSLQAGDSDPEPPSLARLSIPSAPLGAPQPGLVMTKGEPAVSQQNAPSPPPSSGNLPSTMPVQAPSTQLTTSVVPGAAPVTASVIQRSEAVKTASLGQTSAPQSFVSPAASLSDPHYTVANRQPPLNILPPTKPPLEVASSIASGSSMPPMAVKSIGNPGSPDPASIASRGNSPPVIKWKHIPTTTSGQQASETPKDEPSDLLNEAGAIFYIQQNEGIPAKNNIAQDRKPEPPSQAQPDSEDDGEREEEEEVREGEETAAEVEKSLADVVAQTPANLRPSPSIAESSRLPARRGTPMFDSGPLLTKQVSQVRTALGRRPSGARELNASRPYKPETTLPSLPDEAMDAPVQKPDFSQDDVQTALEYLKRVDSDAGSAYSATASTNTGQFGHPPSPPPEELEPLRMTRGQFDHATAAAMSTGPIPAVQVQDSLPYTESSFAPSNKAAERKAKVQAQKDAHMAAVHKPGRANGKKSRVGDAWESSEEEDEEEEEEEDDDVDSDGERLDKGKSVSSHHNAAPSTGHGRNLPMQPVVNEPQSEVLTQHRRNLPQIPLSRSPGPVEGDRQLPRMPSGQYSDRRTYYDEGPHIKTQAEAPMPGAPHQTVWSQVLDPDRPVGRPHTEQRETFVQLEPSETMTKAFTLHGLLSAGIQEKEERSAKKQEELARETGASLVNVPNKPPPPQSGLLGYVTAHERERKRGGGIGATLTEREREKRVAEERQRRFDEQQRQQLDQMQQFGGYNPMMNPMMMGMMGMNGMNPMMAGGMNPMMTGGGMNPMLTGGGMNPMMTGGGMNPMMAGGMNPMMTGGGMNPMMTGGGMNPMMSGFPGMMSPQHMFAAQQAAQVYQQALMTYSATGSQAGGAGGEGGQAGGINVPNMNPGMNTGMGGMPNPATMGNMGGFDPRMSMFGMNNMMGMGMPQPLGTQVTGTSNFDASASPGQAGGNTLIVPNDVGLQPPGSQLSRTSSPAGRGSPRVLGPSEHADLRGRPSRPTSPK